MGGIAVAVAGVVEVDDTEENELELVVVVVSDDGDDEEEAVVEEVDFMIVDVVMVHWPS